MSLAIFEGISLRVEDRFWVVIGVAANRSARVRHERADDEHKTAATTTAGSSSVTRALSGRL